MISSVLPIGAGQRCLDRPLDGRSSSARIRPTRAHPTRTSVRPSTATTASATAASDGDARRDRPGVRRSCCGGDILRPGRGRLPRPGRHPGQGRRAAASRCTRSPAKRTSTSATATRSSRRFRRRPAPAPSTPSTWPMTAPTATRPRPWTIRPNGGERSPCRPRRRPTTRRSSTSAASPYEGKPKPLCDTKLVRLQQRQVGRADVQRLHRRPAAGAALRPDRRRPQLLDRPASRLLYGEKAGVPFTPVGHLRLHNRLITTVETDFNGIYDVLLPSTNRINCPTPSGVCAGMYRFVGERPRRPGPAQPELQPAVPHDRHRVRGDPRPDHPDRPRPDPGGRPRRAARATQIDAASPAR